MQTSPHRRSANLANAQLSTGPRTPEGKARSAQNARKHGLTSKDIVIGPEDREEFDQFLAEFHSDIAPRGALEQALFDQLVAAAWNLRRIRRMETELCSHAASYLDILNDDALQARLDRLARHSSRFERTFHRSLKELKALQTNAAIRPLVPEHLLETGAPLLACAIEIAKRTQSFEAAVASRVPLDPVDLVWCAPDEVPAAASAAGS